MSWLQLVACPVFAERRQWLSLSSVRRQEAEAAEEDQEEGGEDEEKKANLRPVIDPETSIRYLKSKGVRKKHTFFLVHQCSPFYMMSRVGHLAAFLSHFTQNMLKLSPLLAISYVPVHTSLFNAPFSS